MSNENKPVAFEAAEADVSLAPSVHVDTLPPPAPSSPVVEAKLADTKPDAAPPAEAEAKVDRRDPWVWAKAKDVPRRKAGGAIARAKFGAGREVTEAEFDAAIEADAAPFRIG